MQNLSGITELDTRPLTFKEPAKNLQIIVFKIKVMLVWFAIYWLFRFKILVKYVESMNNMLLIHTNNTHRCIIDHSKFKYYQAILTISTYQRYRIPQILFASMHNWSTLYCKIAALFYILTCSFYLPLKLPVLFSQNIFLTVIQYTTWLLSLLILLTIRSSLVENFALTS